ncbi:MAG: hypothetical protein H0T41_04200 [Rhodobacteraceae bacterium]|nr:hypothetical protein [Paracoccaceae bacterium]
MSEQGPRALESDRFRIPEPVNDPFDPIALAARIAEARALRAIALARREQEAGQPGRIVPAAKAAGAGAKSNLSSVLRDPNSPGGVLRANAALRAVPPRTSDPRRLVSKAGIASRKPPSVAPTLSGQALPLAAFLAGCVTVGSGVLLFAPEILPERAGEVTAPDPDAYRKPGTVQLVAPLTLAPQYAEAPVRSPDPVPTFAFDTAEAGRPSSAGFRDASGGSVSHSAWTPQAQARPRSPEPETSTAPQRPPTPFHDVPSVDFVSLLVQPLQPAEGLVIDRAKEVRVAKLPLVSSVRPETAATSPAPIGSASDGDASESSIRPALAAAARVSVYYPTGAGDAAAAALETIGAVGGSRAAATPVGHNIGRTNVRYYHEADLSGARELATALAAEARDFTDFRPQPEPGTIEVWLAGEASSAAPVAASVPRPQRGAALRDRSGIRPEPDRRASVNAVEQQRLEQQVQRLLREQLRELRRR